MQEALDVLRRTLVAYFLMLILARAMGKREVSQMTFFDYIVGITIGGIAAIMTMDTTLKWYNGLIAAIIFAILQIATAVISTRSVKFREIIDGTSTILIEHGKIIDKNLRKERLSQSVLLSRLREKDAFSIADVEYAILEPNGEMSVLKKAGKQPMTPSDMRFQAEYTGLPRVIIENGKPIEETMKYMGLTRSWLTSRLADMGILDVSNVVLAQVDESGNLYADMYDKYNHNLKKDESDALLLSKLEKVRADFYMYSLETKNEDAKELYTDCKSDMEEIIYNFRYYVEQKQAKEKEIKKNIH
ncbi:MAG: DUF421 domain-containing protein [Caulobacteraceae bacterium]